MISPTDLPRFLTHGFGERITDLEMLATNATTETKGETENGQN